MTTANAAGRPGTSQQAVVEVALALLERMGLSPADLTVVPNNRPEVPCDVMFLWPAIDSSNVLEQIPHNPEIEDVIYLPGVVVWRIDRDKVNGGQVLKITGSDIHKQLTVRNSDTVRKLYALMRADTISP
jgi:uncharacterized protein (DUF1697 family)